MGRKPKDSDKKPETQAEAEPSKTSITEGIEVVYQPGRDEGPEVNTGASQVRSITEDLDEVDIEDTEEHDASGHATTSSFPSLWQALEAG